MELNEDGKKRIYKKIVMSRMSLEDLAKSIRADDARHRRVQQMLYILTGWISELELLGPLHKTSAREKKNGKATRRRHR